MNKVLKTKWLWRFAIEDDALWKTGIVSKYAVEAILLTVWGAGNLSFQGWMFLSQLYVLR